MKTELPTTAAAVGVATPHPPSSSSNNPPPPWAQLQRQEFLRRMDRQLDLTQGEHDAIAKIMKESQDRSRPLWDEIAPQMRAELKRVRSEIRAVLTPDQQRKFDDMLKSRGRKQAPEPQSPPPENPPPTNAL